MPLPYTAPPNVPVGSVATSTFQNLLGNDIKSLAATTFPLGISGTIVGTAPAAGPGFAWQAGVFNGTTSGSGTFGFNWPAAFPSGVVIAIPSIPFTGGTQPWQAEFTSITATGVAGTLINTTTGATVNSTAIAVQWLAIGF